jgi:hypothetical protein
MKRCPFEHEVTTEVLEVLPIEPLGTGLFSVVCNVCFARGPAESTAEKAIEKWNERYG